MERCEVAAKGRIVIEDIWRKPLYIQETESVYSQTLSSEVTADLTIPPAVSAPL